MGRRLARTGRRRWPAILAAIGLLAGLTAVQLTFSPAGATSVAGTFELDGNPQASSALVGDDWQNLLSGGTNSAIAKTAIPIHDFADAPNDTSYFKGGGSKDERNVTLWQHSGTDVAPDKDEIVNAAAAAYRVDDQAAGPDLPGTANDDDDTEDDVVITFHADRFSNDGDAAIGFWFFKSRITLNANGSFNGSHSNGDVLVVSDFNEGEGINTIRVFTWTNGALTEVAIPGGNAPKDCQEANHNIFVCATENRANQDDVDSVWPTLYSPKPNVGTAGKYPDFTFLEGGINMSHVVPGSDGCFASFLAETRSSTSTTAQLKDFALGEFPICSPSTSLTASPAPIASGPDAGKASKVVVVGDTVTYTFTELNDGNVPISNVSVDTDNAACDATMTPTSVATLAPLASQVFTCTVQSNATTPAVTTIVATATGTSELGTVTWCANPASPPQGVYCDQDEQATAKSVSIKPGTDLLASAAPDPSKQGDLITFTVTESNDGVAPAGYESYLALSSVQVLASVPTGSTTTTNSMVTACNGGLATPTQKAGGDTDALLEPSETWTYSCQVNAPADDFTIDFTGSGIVLAGTANARWVTWSPTCSNASGSTGSPGTYCDAEEFDNAGVEVIAPSTELVITASAVVTYTFNEKNDSQDAPLHLAAGAPRSSVISVDAAGQACDTPLVFADTDTGVQNVLDPQETWTFTCTGNVAGPTDTPGSGNPTRTSTLTGIGHGLDELNEDVTYCTGTCTGVFPDPDERDRVEVTIKYFPMRGVY